MSFAKSFLSRLKPNSGSLALGLVLGLIAAKALENSMPEAQAQQARITLSSLQDQVNALSAAVTAIRGDVDAIVSGGTPITVSWANVTGIPASIADGDDIGTAGAGLVRNGNVFSVNPNLSVANLAVGGINATGTVSANVFSGSANGLTNVNASQLNGRPISSFFPEVGQSLKWNGASWVPSN